VIRVTDINGCEFYLAATNIASINVAATSSQWHGVRSIVHLFDGGLIECQQEARDIAVQLADHGGKEHENDEIVELQRAAKGRQPQGFIIATVQRAGCRGLQGMGGRHGLLVGGFLLAAAP